jgi:hypothetical protein
MREVRSGLGDGLGDLRLRVGVDGRGRRSVPVGWEGRAGRLLGPGRAGQRSGLTLELCITDSCTMGDIWSSCSEGILNVVTVGNWQVVLFGSVSVERSLRSTLMCTVTSWAIDARLAFEKLESITQFQLSAVVVAASLPLGRELWSRDAARDRQATWLGAPVGRGPIRYYGDRFNLAFRDWQRHDPCMLINGCKAQSSRE